jgi:hypothetical protein
MRIMAVCSNCQRELLLSQLVEGPQITGRCPWCGTLLARHYIALLADAVRRPSALAQSSYRPSPSSAKAVAGSRFGPSLSLIPSGRR